MPLLEACGVTKTFGGLTAVSDVSLMLEPRTITSLIGPNGAGKTTFFNIIAGLYPLTAGRIEFAGRVLADAGRKLTTPPFQVNRRGIARTYQNIRLFSHLTALDNVLAGMHHILRAPLLAGLLRTPAMRCEEARATADAAALLARVGLAGRENQQARHLAYGEQRRLEIARALASRPRLLMLDEPAAGLNASESQSLVQLIRQLRDDLDVTVLLIEHDMAVVMDISERIVVLDHGVHLAEGTPAEIRHHPQVIEAYLGAPL